MVHCKKIGECNKLSNKLNHHENFTHYTNLNHRNKFTGFKHVIVLSTNTHTIENNSVNPCNQSQMIKLEQEG